MKIFMLLQAVCSEIDVVAKVICYHVDSSFKGDRINDWGYCLQQTFQNIQSAKVCFKKTYEIQPWDKWKYVLKYTQITKGNQKGKQRQNIALDKGCKSPVWWTAYNKAKHERTGAYNKNMRHYYRAKQKNLVSAFSALYSIEMLFFDRLNVDINNIQQSRLFTMKEVQNS